MVIGSGVVGSALIERCRANGMQATWAYHSHRPALSRTAGKEIGLCAFERIPENIGKMDAIFCATSGTTPVLQAGLAPFFKPGKPVLVMDLAVPRSVAPELPKRCPGVRLVDMDTLKQWWHREQAVLTDVLASGRQAVREHVVMYEKHVQSFQGRNQR
jgi:glutamyl-tRNA reductase